MQQRAFAGSGRSYDRNHLATLDRKTDPIEWRDFLRARAEGFAQALDAHKLAYASGGLKMTLVKDSDAHVGYPSFNTLCHVRCRTNLSVCPCFPCCWFSSQNGTTLKTFTFRPYRYPHTSCCQCLKPGFSTPHLRPIAILARWPSNITFPARDAGEIRTFQS